MFGFIIDLFTRRRGKDDGNTATQSPKAQDHAAQEATAQFKAQVSQLEDEKRKTAQLKAQIAHFEEEKKKLARLAEEKNKEDKKRAGELADTQASIARLQAKIADLEQQQKAAESKKASQLNESQTKATQLEATVAKLESQIAQLEQENKKLAREKDVLQQDTNTLEKQAQRLEADNKRLQSENKTLEQDKTKWQLERFTPRIAIGGAPPSNQFITVTDAETFRVVEMDYLTANGTKAASQVIDRTGKGVQIPIDESKVTEVQKQGCDPDGSFSMSFRLHLEVDGMVKPFLLSVRVGVNSTVGLEPMPLGAPLRSR